MLVNRKVVVSKTRHFTPPYQYKTLLILFLVGVNVYEWIKYNGSSLI